MSQEDTTLIHPDALELSRLLRPAWPSISAGLRASGVPLNESDDASGGDGDSGEAGGDGDGSDGNEPKTFDADYVKKLRSENAAARKRAQEAEARAKQYEENGLSEVERLKKAAEEGAQRGETGTKKLRTANLIVALGEKGLSGGRAKAAAKLIDVEFDDDDEPKNLDAAMEAASKAYGEDLFAAQSRTTFDGGARQAARTPAGMDAAIRAAAGR